MSKTKFVNGAIIFVSPDVRKTANYYRDVMGFKIVEHYDNEEQFSALYRDAVEIIVVQSKFGNIYSNKQKYGVGYDAYLAPENVEGVDTIFFELKEKGAKIVKSPIMSSYGNYEFVIEDIDNRLIGIGKIKDKEKFFKGIDIQ